MTPLIDIVFQLIIFFLAASHLSRHEPLKEIELPEVANRPEQVAAAPKRIIITVAVDGTYTLGDKAISLGEVEQLLLQRSGESPDEKPEVRIRADRQAAYRSVEPLMTACARAGITNVKFPVESP